MYGVRPSSLPLVFDSYRGSKMANDAVPMKAREVQARRNEGQLMHILNKKGYALVIDPVEIRLTLHYIDLRPARCQR
jgi:hypothetical protein